MITSFSAEVLSKENISGDVVVLSFSLPKSFKFKAGQFVTLMISNGKETKSRSYSILSPPSQKKIDLCIKIVKDGFASMVFKRAKKGDFFEMKGPFGHFNFVDQGTDNYFVCAGTGVTPLYSMIKQHMKKSKNHFTLLFGSRRKENLLFHKEFVELEKKYANFTYIPTLTREKWKGKAGRVQKHLPENLENKTFYICGLKELVLETKELLLSRGVSKNNIKFERYT